MTFIRTRDVPEDWQRDLDRLNPSKERLNWLKIVWQPGETWEPVQRWEIHEMIPVLGHVPAEFIAALKGPNPRTVGELVDGVWESECIVTRMQWDLFKETGCFSQRFWIIQGENGGHKYVLSNVEENFLKALGKPHDTPAPGNRPYAEYNQLVFRKVATYDRLLKWRQNIDWDARQMGKTEAGLWVRRDRQAEERKWAQEMYDLLMDQVEGIVSDVPRSCLPSSDQYPQGDPDVIEDPEDIERDLLESTSTKV
jgi:hypothetical protein